NWRKRDELENEIGKPKQRKSDPDALVAPHAAKTVHQRAPHRIKKHYKRVSAAKPQPAIQPIQARYVLPHLSKHRSRSIGVLEQWSNANHIIAAQHSITPLLHDSLANQSPVRIKWPINK